MHVIARQVFKAFMRQADVYQQYVNELTALDMKALNLLSHLFEEEQKWPSEKAFRQKLKLEIGKENYAPTLTRLSPHFLFCRNEGGRDSHYQLTLAGMCALDRDIFLLVCKYFDYLKEEYQKDPDIKRITSDELLMFLNITEYELLQLRICIDVGGLWGDSASGLSKDKNEKNQKWDVGLYRDIEVLDNADSSEIYLKKILLEGFIEKPEKYLKPVKIPSFTPMFYGGLTEFEQMLDLRILEASGKLFKDGHFSEASLRAIHALEKEVQTVGKISNKGVDLMNKVFSAKNPIIRFNNNQSESDRNEQEGLMFMFRGAMQAIRNLHAHENLKIEELEAKRILVLTSFLMQKLDLSIQFSKISANSSTSP